MYNIVKSWTYIFKEPKWWLKLGIVFALTTLMFLVSLSFGAFEKSPEFREIGYYDYSLSPVLILLCGIFVVVFLVYAIVLGWYQYENTQAAIQNRTTKGIWEGSFVDNFKKAGKYAIHSLLFGIVAGMVLGILMLGIYCMLVVLLGSLMATVDSSAMFTHAADPKVFVFFAFICCAALFFVFLAYIYQFLILLPNQLRLIATNTFGEGFKLGRNLYLAKKYLGAYLGLFGIFLLHIAVYLVLYVGYSIASFTVGVGSTPISIMAIIYAVINFFLMLISTYFTVFVFSHMSGSMYRHILEKEGENYLL